MRFPTRQEPWRALRAGVLALLGLLALLGTARAELIHQAELVLADTEVFPPGVPAQAQALPDLWEQSRPQYQGAAWYRVHLAWQPSRPPLALFIDKLCSNYQLRLNGQLIVSQGRHQDPITDRCDQAQLIDLPRELLQAGDNLVDIKLVGLGAQELGSRLRSARLSALEVGERDMMAARQASALFWRLQLPRLLGGMLLAMAACTAVMASLLRQERQRWHLSGLMLCWAMLSGRLDLWPLPWPQLMQELINLALLGLCSALALLYLLRPVGIRHKALAPLLLVQALLMPVSVALSSGAQQGLLAQGWQVLAGAEVLLAMLAHALLRQRQLRQAAGPGQRQDAAFAYALLGLGACALLLEYGLQLAHRPAWLPLTPLAIPAVLLGLGLQALLQLGRARRLAEQSLLQTELRMQERIAEIERSYSAQAEQKLEQVTERERKRIAADLHDDLGAKLLTIVHTSESDRISTLAREALEEMRLSVRGLTGKPVQLLDALGDWRAEVVSRLGQANILAEWKAPAEDIVHTLPARAYVQTTRILREAVSNIIKHSGATHCVVSCNVQDGDFQVIIQDNGQGIPMELDGRLDRGHGMASMKSRAKQMQGQCLVESGPGWGTVIRLTIPL